MIITVIDFKMLSENAISNAGLTRQRGLGYVNIPVNKNMLSNSLIGGLDEAMRQNKESYLFNAQLNVVVLRRAKRMGGRQSVPSKKLK